MPWLYPTDVPRACRRDDGSIVKATAQTKNVSWCPGSQSGWNGHYILNGAGPAKAGHRTTRSSSGGAEVVGCAACGGLKELSRDQIVFRVRGDHARHTQRFHTAVYVGRCRRLRLQHLRISLRVGRKRTEGGAGHTTVLFVRSSKLCRRKSHTCGSGWSRY